MQRRYITVDVFTDRALAGNSLAVFLDGRGLSTELMQALARVNRTFRNKQDGLLVGYAPLTENIYAALAEYTARDQTTKPLGRDVDDAGA